MAADWLARQIPITWFFPVFSATTDLRVGSLYKLIDTKVILTHTGDTSWLAPAIIKTECKVFMENFPFDEQICPMKFGSWTHDGHHLDIQLYQDFGMDTEEFSENREWYLVGTKGRRDVKLYNCCPAPYPTLTYTITLRRRALFYLFNLVFPCAVIAFLTLFSFKLPPNSGERVSLVVTILLALSVYMLLVTENMPQSSDLPLASKFFMAIMIQIAASLVVTCYIIKWHHSTQPIGPWISYYVNEWLAKLMFMKSCKHKISHNSSIAPFQKRDPPVIEIQPVGDVTNYEEECVTGRVDTCVTDATLLKESVALEKKEAKTEAKIGQSSDGSIDRAVVKELKVLSKKVQDESTAQEIQDEWMRTAEVLDRFFLILFVVTLFLTLVCIYAQIPSNVTLV